jgi:hypothetical protein
MELILVITTSQLTKCVPYILIGVDFERFYDLDGLGVYKVSGEATNLDFTRW